MNTALKMRPDTLIDLRVPAHRAPDSFAIDVGRGLSRKMKRIPSKYLYDARGSQLFSMITELPAYYPTRIENKILSHFAKCIATRMIAKDLEIVEFGPGDGSKTLSFLTEIAKSRPFSYSFVDIDKKSVETTHENIENCLPGYISKAIVGDYSRGLEWFASENSNQRLILFLGSNIGNFTRIQTLDFLKRLRCSLRPGDFLLCGFDLKKDFSILQNAYSDTEGVTREFNLNLLLRMNRELGANFDTSDFEHYATYNPRVGAMESFLISQKEHSVYLSDLNLRVDFDQFEPIHTEYSHKYTPQIIDQLAKKSGFRVVENFSDENDLFVDSLWTVSIN